MSERTLALRAATYFGMQTEPRRSIRVGRAGCIVVAEREPGRRVLAHYDEEYSPTGMYLSLTEKQREALVEALS